MKQFSFCVNAEDKIKLFFILNLGILFLVLISIIQQLLLKVFVRGILNHLFCLLPDTQRSVTPGIRCSYDSCDSLVVCQLYYQDSKPKVSCYLPRPNLFKSRSVDYSLRIGKNNSLGPDHPVVVSYRPQILKLIFTIKVEFLKVSKVGTNQFNKCR